MDNAADGPAGEAGGERSSPKTYGYDPNEAYSAEPIRPDEKAGLGWMWLLLLLPLLGGAFFLRSSLSGGSARLHLGDCQKNLRTLAAAVDAYAAAHKGALPKTLAEVTQAGNLTQVPVCPAAGTVTYQYVLAKDRHSYNLYCGGVYHADVLDKRADPAAASDLPAYNSQTGEIVSP